MHRAASVAALALILTLPTGCGNNNSAEIAELEQRIRELEQELAGARSGEEVTEPPTTSTTAGTTTSTTFRQTTTTTSGPADLTLEDSGFSDVSTSSFNAVSYSLILHNPNRGHAAWQVAINLSWFDAAGNLVGSTPTWIDYITPGRTAAMAGALFDVVGAETMEVQFRTGEWLPRDQANEGWFSTRDVQVRTDEITTSALAIINSDYADEMRDPMAVAVFRNADGTILGGTFTIVDFVPAMGEIPVEIDGPALDAASAEVYVHLSNSSFSYLEE